MNHDDNSDRVALRSAMFRTDASVAGVESQVVTGYGGYGKWTCGQDGHGSISTFQRECAIAGGQESEKAEEDAKKFQ